MNTAHLIVVGGGIIGVQHALLALDLGHRVTLVERDPAPVSASVRNFGLIWLSGRRPGPELELARRSRERWEQLGHRIPELGFRAAGSLTVARTPAELAVLEAYVAVAPSRGLDVELLDAAGIARVAPAVRGDGIAGVLCRDDAIVEPRRAAPTLLDVVEQHDRARVLRGCSVTSFSSRADGVRVETTAGILDGDLLVGCPGAEHAGPFAELLERAPLERCRLEMLETEPLLGGGLPLALADGDSLRYYPGFSELPEAAALPPADPIVARERLQLLVAPRLDGALTVGDSHRYDEPFPFDLDEDVADHWLRRLQQLLGVPTPRVRRRWWGVYSRHTGPEPYLRVSPDPRVQVVTGIAGMGMTASAGVALDTMEILA